MDTLKRIALTLVIIGAINWGLIGLFDFDLVATLLGGQDSVLSRIVYSLVGLAGLLSIPFLFESYREVDNRAATGRLNYGTEFGEEEDFSRIKKDDRDL